MTYPYPYASDPYAYIAPHAVSTRIDPATPIASSSIANPSIVTTTIPHGLATGDTVAIAGHTSTPPIAGPYVVTVIDPLSFSIPLAVSVAGTSGTVTRTIAAEPLTLAEGKLRAGLDWLDGDPRDDLMRGFIATARQHVERRTERALMAQTRDVYFDALPGWIVDLPSLCTPLVAVLTVEWLDTGNAAHVLDPSMYLVDLVSGRIALNWSTVVYPAGVRLFQPWHVRIIAGASDVSRIPAPLLQAVGLLVGHYATLGRDLSTLSAPNVFQVPQGFEDLIAPWVPVEMP